jgi:hypothetical protein
MQSEELTAVDRRSMFFILYGLCETKGLVRSFKITYIWFGAVAVSE